LLLISATGHAAAVIDRVDWPAFLARHDLVWNRPPERWESGAFLGNGLLGANVFTTEDGKRLKWHIGRSDVVDRGSRIPIGDLVLVTAGDVQGADLRLDLWNAELSGKIKTSRGEIGIRTFTHSDQLVQVTELSPTAGEAECHFDWKPGLAANPRYAHQRQPVPRREWNPDPEVKQEGELNLAIQPLSRGGGHVTAWRELTGQDRGQRARRIVVISVGFSTW
jgi:hypothetical protein